MQRLSRLEGKFETYTLGCTCYIYITLTLEPASHLIYAVLGRLRCQFLHPLHHATMTLIQISKVTGIAEVGDTEDNSPEVTNEIIDGDANSTNSNSDNDEAEEVVSNRRIQRVGVVGRSFKRRRIRE
nr:uncharacterized protein LOC127341881 isoform X3 [Lolium perenne]